MVDLFTPLDRYRLPEVGAKLDLWAPPTVDGLNDGVADMIDEALGNDVFINLAAGDVTLTKSDGVTDEARPLSITAFNNVGGSRNLIVPDPETSKLYFIRSSSTGDVVFKTVSGVGVTIGPGEDRWVYVDEGNDETGIIDFVGDTVSLLPPDEAADTVLCDIEFASAGDTQVTIAYWIQGNIVHVRLPTFSSTITPGGNWNRVRLLPNTPASFVGLIDATFPHNEPCYGLVNAVSEPFNVDYPRFSVDQIDVMPTDSLPFKLNNDILTMPHVVHATYVADNTNQDV